MERSTDYAHRWAHVLTCTLTVTVVGSLLHFAWGWSGRSAIVALVAPINESTWEHLKMAFWPALALAPIQRRLYGRLPGLLVTTAVRCLLAPVLIVAFFYAYTYVLGDNVLIFDVTIFALAVFIAELAGHRLLSREFGSGVRLAAGLALLGAAVSFFLFTYYPPDLFLFDDPLVSSSIHP